MRAITDFPGIFTRVFVHILRYPLYRYPLLCYSTYMNPSQAFANRTARLVQESTTPVYSTSTPAREHILAVEVEFDTGGRLWTSMPESEVEAFCEGIHPDDFFSDVDHSAKCWCQK